MDLAPIILAAGTTIGVLAWCVRAVVVHLLSEMSELRERVDKLESKLDDCEREREQARLAAEQALGVAMALRRELEHHGIVPSSEPQVPPLADLPEDTPTHSWAAMSALLQDARKS